MWHCVTFYKTTGCDLLLDCKLIPHFRKGGTLFHYKYADILHCRHCDVWFLLLQGFFIKPSRTVRQLIWDEHPVYWESAWSLELLYYCQSYWFNITLKSYSNKHQFSVFMPVQEISVNVNIKIFTWTQTICGIVSHWTTKAKATLLMNSVCLCEISLSWTFIWISLYPL